MVREDNTRFQRRLRELTDAADHSDPRPVYRLTAARHIDVMSKAGEDANCEINSTIQDVSSHCAERRRAIMPPDGLSVRLSVSRSSGHMIHHCESPTEKMIPIPMTYSKTCAMTWRV